ncbi:MAG: AraC family transcriptional regulator [Burkholderiaceae bacterium]
MTWTQRVAGFAALPQLIQQLGGDAEAVFAGAGLERSTFSRPDNRVSFAALASVLDRAATNTGCAHIGLLAGRMFHLSNMGVVGELVRNSPTVGAALEALTVHHHLNSEGGLAFLLNRGDYVDLGYAMYHPAVPGSAHMHDAALAAGMNIMLELCGPTWKPYEVLLPHAKPHDVAQYRSFLKVVPRFDAESSVLRFPARDLARRVPDADPQAYRRCEHAARVAGAPEFMQQIYRGLRRLMLENRHSGDDLAQMLSLHRRTLNRRLKAEGTTFQRVLDEVRFEIAQDLLRHSNVHLDDIAATLGYAAVTPFMRTFRRWSGTTPGQWRRSARNGENAAAA